MRNLQRRIYNAVSYCPVTELAPLLEEDEGLSQTQHGPKHRGTGCSRIKTNDSNDTNGL